MLKHLAKVMVRFAPGDAKATSAMDILAFTNGESAKKSNPKCQVAFEIDESLHGMASVELSFNDKTNLKLSTSDLSIQEIMRTISRKGGEMELRSVLAEVKGYDPWKEGNRIVQRDDAS
jgi:hypothetical protein